MPIEQEKDPSDESIKGKKSRHGSWVFETRRRLAPLFFVLFFSSDNECASRGATGRNRTISNLQWQSLAPKDKAPRSEKRRARSSSVGRGQISSGGRFLELLDLFFSFLKKEGGSFC